MGIFFKSDEERARDEYKDGYSEGRNTTSGEAVMNSAVDFANALMTCGLVSDTRTESNRAGYEDGLKDR